MSRDLLLKHAVLLPVSLLLWVPGTVSGQDFLGLDAPSGVNGGFSGVNGGFSGTNGGFGGTNGGFGGTDGEIVPGGWEKRHDGEGFLFGIGVRGMYDSNLFLDEDAMGDFVGILAPWVTYNSAPPGGAEWILSGSYSPSFSTYLDNSSLDSVDQGGRVKLAHAGPRSTLDGNVAYRESSRANRFLGGRLSTETTTMDLDGNYEISPLTSLRLELSQGIDNSGLTETETRRAQLSAFWVVSPLLKIGPSIRYGERESGIVGGAESLALLASADYEISGLARVQTSAGIETVDQAIGPSETNFTGSVGLHYQAPNLPWSANGELRYGAIQQLSTTSRNGGGGNSPISGRLGLQYAFAEDWALGTGVFYRTFPAPAGEGYSIDDLTFQASVSRVLDLGSLHGRVSYSLSEYEVVAAGTPPRSSEETYGVGVSYRTRILRELLVLDCGADYSVNRGREDWEQFQLTTGLSYAF